MTFVIFILLDAYAKVKTFLSNFAINFSTMRKLYLSYTSLRI